jgi:hypothetical protein
MDLQERRRRREGVANRVVCFLNLFQKGFQGGAVQEAQLQQHLQHRLFVAFCV